MKSGEMIPSLTPSSLLTLLIFGSLAKTMESFVYLQGKGFASFLLPETFSPNPSIQYFSDSNHCELVVATNLQPKHSPNNYYDLLLFSDALPIDLVI